MIDVVEKLRSTAEMFELADAPRHTVLHMRAAADEIERMRAATDLVRAEVLEEAARVADGYEGKGMDGGYDSHLEDAFRTRREIAAAIRALKGIEQ